QNEAGAFLFARQISLLPRRLSRVRVFHRTHLAWLLPELSHPLSPGPQSRPYSRSPTQTSAREPKPWPKSLAEENAPGPMGARRNLFFLSRNAFGAWGSRPVPLLGGALASHSTSPQDSARA